ncbi:MAG: radical SAM protein, partial [bacterium]
MKDCIGKIKDTPIVALFFPKLYPEQKVQEGKKVFIPLSILTVGSYVMGKGISVLLIDSRVEKEDEYKENLLSLKDRLLCVGVSVLTNQIPDGVNFSRFIKEKLPEVPVIWGGWHATIFHEETIKSPYVDIIVKGEGEYIFSDLLSHLLGKKSLDNILGINYKLNGEIKINPPMPVGQSFPTNKLYYEELLDLSLYEVMKGEIGYRSSRGCPHRCAYCLIQHTFHRRWIGKPANEVVEDIIYLKERFNIHHVKFLDDNFFTERERVKKICEGFIAHKVDITWEVNGHVNTLNRTDFETFKLIKKAGCIKLTTGVESGSTKMLTLLQKDIKIETVIPLAKRIREAEIPFRTNFIVGLPKESKEDLLKTFKIIQELYKINLDQLVAIYLYSPIPGTILYEWEIKHGEKIHYPSSIEEWANYKFDKVGEIDASKPWTREAHLMSLEGYRDRRYIKLMTFYLWICCLNPKV